MVRNNSLYHNSSESLTSSSPDSLTIPTNHLMLWIKNTLAHKRSWSLCLLFVALWRFFQGSLMIAALNLPRVFRFLFNLFWIDMTLLVTYRHGRPLGCQPQPLLKPASSTWLSGDVSRSSKCSARSTSLLISAHGCLPALFAGQWSPGILRRCR